MSLLTALLDKFRFFCQHSVGEGIFLSQFSLVIPLTIIDRSIITKSITGALLIVILDEECTSEALSITQDEQIEELETKIRQLQDALLFLKAGSDEIDDLGNKIIRLRDKKNALLEEKALASQRASEIRKCIADIEGMSGPLENFDEGYVRKLITRINLFDDHLDFIFKNGQTITINE